ncbi:unnamed protein product [Penicillium olsonii]|nr:unnamed protein product [Penicillium olsonii]
MRPMRASTSTLSGRIVRNIWTWARPSASFRRREIDESNQSKTEPFTIPTQQSTVSDSQLVRSSDETPVILHLGDATNNDRDTGGPKLALESRSFPNSRPAWTKGIDLCGYATAGFLLLNVVFISVAGALATKYPEFEGSASSKVMYDGPCTAVGWWNSALHAVINIISTCTLGASNYCMQTLVAPTREEIDASHAKRRWLNVGGQSIRNLSAISNARLGLWVVLCITAIPFHLLYNSFVSRSFTYNSYWSFVAPHDFITRDVRNLTTPALQECFKVQEHLVDPVNSFDEDTEYFDWNEVAVQITESRSIRLTAKECENVFGGRILPGYKGLILLTSNRSMSEGGNESVLAPRWCPQESPSGSICAVPFMNSHPLSTPSHQCTNLTISDWDTGSDELSLSMTECVAIEGNSNCQLPFQPLIGVIMIIVTFVKVIAIFFASRIHRSRIPPLLTTCDAIASFLEAADETTKGMCWASASSIKQGGWRLLPRIPETHGFTAIYRHLDRPQRLRKAAGVASWTMTLLIVLGSFVGGLVLYFLDPLIEKLRANKARFTFWTMVKVEFSPRSKFRPTEYPVLQGIVISNCGQLLITLGYYLYNSVLTNMLLSAEYASYGSTRKPLRVSWPVEGSKQRSTYRLSIPYRYGIPVVAIFAGTHWLVSQGFSYTLEIPYNVRGNLVYEDKWGGISSSYIPFICASIPLFCLGIMLIGMSFRRLKSDIPLAGSCSAAISAACHPPEGVCRATAAHGALKWGETGLPPGWNAVRGNGNETPRGHCSFTPLQAKKPSLDKLYA